jgi:RimJ/RimL family protein N-acetyltransferase
LDLVAPDPSLSDGAVTLRLWEEGDLDALVDGIDGDEDISRWLELIPQPYTLGEARTWVNATRRMWSEGTASPFAITASGAVVGGVGVNWIERDHGVGDVGYWLRRDARGKGYATRAVQLAVRWAFESGAERIQLRADAQNTASIAVAERAGFRREGVIRSSRYNPRIGRRMDFVLFSLLPGEL